MIVAAFTILRYSDGGVVLTGWGIFFLAWIITLISAAGRRRDDD